MVEAATRLGREFFGRPATEVAPELIGKLLVCEDEGLVARIVEVEAYMQHDPACHAFERRTTRIEPLYGPPGHAYVYFTYGMHWCMNVTTGSEGRAEGCLLRAAEPLEGLARMRQRRGRASDRDLLRGPARLAQAFGIEGGRTGEDLCADGPIHLADDGCRPEVVRGPRVGVVRAPDTPWRFTELDSRWVSAYRRHPRA